MIMMAIVSNIAVENGDRHASVVIEIQHCVCIMTYIPFETEACETTLLNRERLGLCMPSMYQGLSLLGLFIGGSSAAQQLAEKL